MSTITLLLIALGASADAFAVAIGKGLQLGRLRARTALALALTFGLFQGLMPVLGWLLGTRFRDSVTGVDHWIAFALLGGIGLKMILDARGGDDAEEGSGGDDVPLRELLLLGLATSIDALAIGISLAFDDVSIVVAGLVIGAVTFVVSLAGAITGHRVGSRFRGPAEVVGGLILIGIGTRILIEHLTA